MSDGEMPDEMTEDALVVEYKPVREPRRRLVIRPTDHGWLRRVDEWTGSTWRSEGAQVLDGVDVTNNLPAAVTVTGPK